MCGAQYKFPLVLSCILKACLTWIWRCFGVAANARSEFTGLISTSNQIVGEVVEVETDADVVWITEVVT